MIKSGRVNRGWASTLAVPGIQPNVVMVAAGTDKNSTGTIAKRNLKTQEALIKGERAVDICYLQMYMPDPCLRWNCITHN